MLKKLGTFFLGVGLLVMITAIILSFVAEVYPLALGLLLILILIPVIHKKMLQKRFVVWSDEYSVGIESIDEQHKRLIDLINQLQTAVHYYTGDEYIDKALDDLVDYTKTHFSYEEGLMEQNGYADFDAHKLEHQAMIDKVSEAIESYHSDPDRAIEGIIQFLKEWLIAHINGTDKNYSTFLIEKGIK